MYTKYLKNADRDAMQYVVVPTAGIVVPIVYMPAKSEAYTSIFAGNLVDVNEYLQNGAIHYPGTAKL
jgi:hypothetical protein